MSDRRAWLWAMFVLLVVWAVGRETINYDFVAWDDELNILLNPHLGPPDAHNLKWMFSDVGYMRRYVPFGWLGFSIAYTFSGLSPVAYHAGCLLLHGLNALLLFAVTRWIVRRECVGIEEARLNRCAAIGALFWAIHPLRAETIGWSSGTLYSLACAFALLSVLAYCRAQTASSSGSRGWRWAAVAFYAISMLTYPITLGLIGVFLAIDVLEWHVHNDSAAPVKPRLRLLALQKIPFVLSAVGAMGVTLYGRFTTGGLWTTAPTLGEFGLIDRMMRGVYTAAFYLWETLWPAGLTPLPTQLATFSPFGVAALSSAVILSGITFCLWMRRNRGALLLWLCFLVMLLPLLGLTEKEFYTSDRYMYFPGLAASVGLASVLAFLPSRVRPIGEVGTVPGLIVLGAMCHAQLSFWQNSATLFARSVALSSDPKLTENTYRRWIDFHGSRGDLPAAKVVLERATNEGLRWGVLADLATSVNLMEQEIRSGLPPLLARIHAETAISLVRQKRSREADEHFTAALRLAPRFSMARYNQALLAAASGDPRRASSLLLSAIANGPGDLPPTVQQAAWHLVGNAFEAKGEKALAARARERAAAAPSQPH